MSDHPYTHRGRKFHEDIGEKMLRVAATLNCFPQDHMNRVYDPEYCCPCLNAGGGGNIYPKILIRRKNMIEKKEKFRAEDNDRIQ